MPKLRIEWMKSLSMRENLLCNDVPYIPILVEDIPKYTSLTDFEENCIKTVQTIGEVTSVSNRYGTILSLTPGLDAEFPVSFKNLSIASIYHKNTDDTYSAIWDKYNAFKIFGTLLKNELNVVLECNYIVPVQDPMGSWRVMQLLSVIARRDYRQYNRTPRQNETLKLHWERMKIEKKRLINEKRV